MLENSHIQSYSLYICKIKRLQTYQTNHIILSASSLLNSIAIYMESETPTMVSKYTINTVAKP